MTKRTRSTPQIIVVCATIALAIAICATPYAGGAEPDAKNRHGGGGDDKKLIDEGQADLPLRHLRRRAAVDRHAAHNEVIESAVDPADRPVARTESRRRRTAGCAGRRDRGGQVDLTDPATTLALIKLNAVVGVVGTVETIERPERLTKVGITCALCHSTVDDSFAPGIGQRLDGWPNRRPQPRRDHRVSPAVPDAAKAVYNSWGPGKYDPRFNQDGQNTPVVIPPAFGLAGVSGRPTPADGPISYWNKYVAVTQMGGHGSFVDRPHRRARGAEARPGEAQARRRCELPVQPGDAGRPDGSFDRARRGARPHRLPGGRQVRHLPQRPPLHRHQPRPAHDPAKSGWTRRTRSQRDEEVSHHAAARAGDPRPLLPRRQRRDAGDVVDHYDGLLHLGSPPAEDDLVEYLKRCDTCSGEASPGRHRHGRRRPCRLVSISRRWTTTACSKELLRTFFVEFVEDLFLPEVDACLGRGTIEFPDEQQCERPRSDSNRRITDLQSVPLVHLGTRPCFLHDSRTRRGFKSVPAGSCEILCDAGFGEVQ